MHGRSGAESHVVFHGGGTPAFADEPRAGSATGLFQYSGTGRSGRYGGRQHVARPPALPPRRQAGDAAQSVGLVGRRPFGSPFEKSGQRRHSGQSARFRRLYRQPQALLVVRPQSAHERFDAVPLRAVPLLQDGRERAGTQSGPQFGCLCGSRVQLLVSYRREVLCRCAREVSGRAGPCQVLFHAVQRLARRERVVCRGRRRIGGQQQPADHPHPSGGGTGRSLPQLLPARRHGVRREVQARRLRCGLRHRCDLRADSESAGFGGGQRHRFHCVEQGQFDARHRKPEADLRRCAGRCVGGCRHRFRSGRVEVRATKRARRGCSITR